MPQSAKRMVVVTDAWMEGRAAQDYNAAGTLGLMPFAVAAQRHAC